MHLQGPVKLKQLAATTEAGLKINNFHRHIFIAVFLLTRHSSVFPNHSVKLRASDQPPSAWEKSILTCHIT